MDEKSILNDNHDVFFEEKNENLEENKNQENMLQNNIFSKQNDEDRIWKEQFLKHLSKKIEEKSKGQGYDELGAVISFFKKLFEYKATIPNADRKIKQVLVCLSYDEKVNKSTVHPKTFLPCLITFYF